MDASWARERFDGWQAPIAHARQHLAGSQFTCMHRTFEISAAQAWQSACADRLWLYHLHYFDDLTAVHARQRDSVLFKLIVRWIDENPPAMGVGWEPYPLSRRIVNWCKWWLGGGPMPTSAAASLAVQADMLHRSLEFDVLGNHLLANAKALIFAGLLLDSKESESWISTGRRILVSQLPEQILPDGGHYERSPMYHAAVLEDLLDLKNVCAAAGKPMPEIVEQSWPAMLEWLRVLSHPDGRIAQFNDAALDGAPTYAEIEEYARRLGVVRRQITPYRRITHLRDSGYVRVEGERFSALLDVAPLGPDFQPGHGHADSLSFELSLDGQRLVVDTGTGTYTAGPERQHERSTAAHNTVEIDHANSSEVWGSFRVGRRARPMGVSVRDTHDALIVTAAHDGYRRTSSRAVHRRTWRFDESSLVIHDELLGSTTHHLRWTMHLAPGVSVERSDSHRFGLRSEAFKGAVTMRLDPRLQWHAEEAVYYPTFGRALLNTRIVGVSQVQFPTAIDVEFRW